MKTNQEIKELKINIDNIYSIIWKCEYESVDKDLQTILPKVTETMVELVEVLGKLKAYGVDIPTDILLGQLNNLMNSYEHKDYVTLADTLHYEINDSLGLYIEINDELKKENIIL